MKNIYWLFVGCWHARSNGCYLYDAGALRSGVVEMLPIHSTSTICHTGVCRAILVLVLRMVVEIKIWTECAALQFCAVRAILSAFHSLALINSKIAWQEGPPIRATFLSEYSESSPFCFHLLTRMVIRKLHGEWHSCFMKKETTTGPTVSFLFLMLYCWLFEHIH